MGLHDLLAAGRTAVLVTGDWSAAGSQAVAARCPSLRTAGLVRGPARRSTAVLTQDRVAIGLKKRTEFQFLDRLLRAWY